MKTPFPRWNGSGSKTVVYYIGRSRRVQAGKAAGRIEGHIWRIRNMVFYRFPKPGPVQPRKETGLEK
jgi:hypothetical protein